MMNTKTNGNGLPRNKMSFRKKVALFAGVIVILAALALAATLSGFFKPQAGGDFSSLSYSESFARLNQTLSDEYAFTDWKAIDWSALYERYAPQIAAAEADHNPTDFYRIIHAYLAEIPDGHVRMNANAAIDQTYLGGGFGLSIARLDDDRVIVTWTDPKGPAQTAGILPGDELVEWNGLPILKALSAVDLSLTGTAATKEYREQKQTAYLVRAPIGTTVSLTISHEPADQQNSAQLTAYADQNQSLRRNYPYAVVSDKLRDMFVGNENPDPVPESIVTSKLLTPDIGYVKLLAELDADLQQTGTPESTLQLMKNAIQFANENKCSGLILDLRNNIGGLDSMAADILGLFYPEKTLYEYQKTFGSKQLTPLYIQPAQEQFSGSIIALINSRSVSNAEGLAMGISNLPNGETLGFYGTNGSFGLAGSEIKLPEGITVEFPSGQSLDQNKNIQIDSRNGVGGVSPTIRIPMTAQNALRIANGEDVELEIAVEELSK